MKYIQMNIANVKACKPQISLTVSWTNLIPVAVGLECLWCSPNVVVLWREHAFLPEMMILAELITPFTLNSYGNKSSPAPSGISSSSLSLLSTDCALLGVIARSKCLWEAGNTSLSCLGGSPGEYFLSPGIQSWCFEWGESVSLGTSGTMNTIIILLVMLPSVW